VDQTTQPPKIEFRPLIDLVPDPRNARTHSPEQIDQIVASIAAYGWTNPILHDSHIRAGHGRSIAAAKIYDEGGLIALPSGAVIPFGAVPVIDCSGWSEDAKRAYTLADNQLALNAGWDEAALIAEIRALSEADYDIGLIGFDDDYIKALLNPPEQDDGPANAPPNPAGALAAEFLIPPFSVLSARQGWWQDRKRQWLALGIKSELGRGENLLKMSDTMLEPDPEKRAAMQALRDGEKTGSKLKPVPGGGSPMPVDRAKNGKRAAAVFRQDLMRDGPKLGLGGVTMNALSSHPRYYEQKTVAEAKVGRKLSPDEFERDHWVLPDSELSSGTSIFDPVICELAYRWFCPPKGTVLDPFAGGSVRGVVAAALGLDYCGVELRAEQVDANAAQWPQVAANLRPAAPDDMAPPPLRADVIEGLRVVRDDEVRGGTKRRALDLILPTIDADEFVYATPCYGFAQIALGYAAAAAGKKATVFVAHRNERHRRTALAKSAGANIIEVEAGRLNVIQSRARKYCEESGAYLVPFGMDDEMFVAVIAEIARGLPGEAPTEVWCVAGSGTLTRALQRAWPDADHHAVQIGRAPEIGNAKLWLAPEKFEDDALDPPPFPSCSNYDAKAWQFIKQHASPGALFWNVGGDLAPPSAISEIGEPRWITGDSLAVLPELDLDSDFVFSCPPYGDLEVYSDDPRDISTLDAGGFDQAYAEIVKLAVARLKDDRFAMFVVGDYRNKAGIYANFVSKTIAAFEAAGAQLYNEAILVTTVGSLPIRTAKQFRATRKFGKTHQNILVFVKGDPVKATLALGPVDVSDSLLGLIAEDD
jgi:DNA modification methylase